MTNMRKAIGLAAAAMSGAALSFGVAAAAHAADAGHPYDLGPVWEISHVETKPGHFEDYMKYVATNWRAEQEALKKAGLVLDYKVLNLTDARDGEADLLLLVEWKNMAAFDTPIATQDAIVAQVFGSVAASDQAALDRESIRHLGSDILTREMVLKPAK
jgi:hypothetical protein